VLNLLGGLSFLGFVAMVRGVARGARAPAAARRRRASALLLYAVAASFGAGLTQRDAWPFAKWPMAGGRADAEAQNTRLRAVDEAGAEHEIDYRAWQPIGFDELIPWAHRTLPRLPAPAQDAVAAHLLSLAEAARARTREGGRPGVLGGWLGPLAAPCFDLHPRLWRRAADAPARPFVKLRVYRERWNQEARRREPWRVQRTLLLEFPR
jgi:hypothetical protein